MAIDGLLPDQHQVARQHASSPGAPDGKHAPDRTQSEFVDSLIMAAAMSDPDVSRWLESFHETNERLATELVIG